MTQRRIPPAKTESAVENGAEPSPDAFVIPTDLLVQTAQLIARIPAGQVGDVLLRLQQLKPVTKNGANGG